MKKIIIPFVIFVSAFTTSASAQGTIVKYLSGTDKDHTIPWEFFCTEGANSGKWTTIPVPSNWELQGFGGYNYGHEKNKHHEHGLYKYHFTADKAWKDKEIELVFEGVMTDAEVKINGRVAGTVHQGSFYRFSYNITQLIKPGADNLLEVDVSKMSNDSTVNKAERESDFWVFGGIYRPVYLNIEPRTHIEHVAIDAKANGKLTVEVYGKNWQHNDFIHITTHPINDKQSITSFGQAVPPIDSTSLEVKVDHPQLWSSEFPNLYEAEISIIRGKEIIHQVIQRFGFRTVEVRPGDGIYVNDKKIRFKGVNRHSFWPESGRTLSRDVHLLDIGLIKDMNMNAVRMSHYPPDPEFLDLCDSLGLFVLDELTGWQKKYGTPVGRKLVRELVVRDVNHPSVIFWDNGNEGGFNRELDNDYALYDPQKRTVLHPWELFNHVDTKHYPDYAYVEKAAEKNNILLHTEMIHGLYDGGHGAGLEDYWNLMLQNPRHAGGFLWALFDEGVVRKDRNDSIDTYGNNAPDGIVGPHREKEGSYFTIKEIWSPVQIKKPVLDQTFTGKLEVSNRYDFTDLSAVHFNWQLIRFPSMIHLSPGHTVISSGTGNMQLAPGNDGSLSLSLPADWQKADALKMVVTDSKQQEIVSWTWPIKSVAEIAQKSLLVESDPHDLPVPGEGLHEKTAGNIYTVSQYDDVIYHFDTITGMLQHIDAGTLKKIVPFTNGPVLAGDKQSLQSFHHYKKNGNVIIDLVYSGKDSLWIKWIIPPYGSATVEYRYTQKEAADFSGITFHLDESKITGIKWLGDGPYRVWKNRLKGASLDIWEKKYNNTITGETFDYPEFPGYYANLHWAKIENTEVPFAVLTSDQDTYLQLFHPGVQKTKFNPFVNPSFPEENFGLMRAIPPIGTKFREAATMGPQSQKNPAVNGYVTGSMRLLIFWQLI